MESSEQVKKLKKTVGELEAMVAMAEPPSPDRWGASACMAWRDRQRKIQRKLDGIAKRMKAREVDNG